MKNLEEKYSKIQNNNEDEIRDSFKPRYYFVILREIQYFCYME